MDDFGSFSLNIVSSPVLGPPRGLRQTLINKDRAVHHRCTEGPLTWTPQGVQRIVGVGWRGGCL